MFSFLRRKKTKPNEYEQPTSSIDLGWLDEYLVVQDDFVRADWSEIHRYVETNLSDYDQHCVWCDIARHWAKGISEPLAADCCVTKIENFIIVSHGNERFNDALGKFLEHSLRRLLYLLEGVASDAGFGKYVVVAFDDVDSYYDYVGFYYGSGDGVYGLSSGMYINNGYGHFVFVEQDLANVEAIVAHEMTHALLSHRSLPLWLDEGLAVNMEALITGMASDRLSHSVVREHQEFWSEEGIQQFWCGDSFSRSDEGQRLSYQLAQVLVSNLAQNSEDFKRFVMQSNCRDGGEEAMMNVYGASLGDLVLGFLGDATPWSPEPESWLVNQS